MSRLPSTLPPGATLATWSDFGRLLHIAAQSQLRVMRRQPALGALFVGLLVVLVIEGIWIGGLMGSTAPVIVLMALTVGAIVIFVLAHTAYRLLDRHRLVLLSSSGRSGLDVRFGSARPLIPSNHGRLRGDTSAPALRAAVAEWARSLPIDGVSFKAQNRRVAQLYAAQFPELVIGPRDALGHVELTFHRGDGHRSAGV